MTQGVGVGDVDPSSHQYPGVQAVQETVPPDEYSPTGHIEGFVIGSGQANPSGQEVQFTAPGIE